MTNSQSAFLKLIRLGIGKDETEIPISVDWDGVEVLAERHGLLGVIVDGVQKLPENQRPPQLIWLRWVGKVMQNEAQYAAQQKASTELALMFHNNGIRTYVLKGAIVAECYPKPSCRLSADFDCFLVNENQNENENNVWEIGNQVIENAGFEVKRNFYKNSTFLLPGLTVENHRFLTPFRGNKTLRKLEQYLQSAIRSHKPQPSDFFHQTSLCRPPVMVSALFLIEHAYSHFLHEGLNWRYVLDWVMFSQKHKAEIDWSGFDALIDEFDFRRFYDSYCRLGKYLIGQVLEDELSFEEERMLEDVWAPLDLHETTEGVKGKIALAGNTLRARWKYRYFSPISMPHALWIQVKGYLFEKNPKLS